MGGIVSSNNDENDKPERKNDHYNQIVNEKCSKIRLDSINSTKKLFIDTKRVSYTIEYCYVSQRGYYPNAQGKANQDSYSICENILSDKNCHFFGIFDGHGEYGDLCSHFTAVKVPHYLCKELKSNGGTSAFESNAMETVVSESYTKVNKALKKSAIDDSLSGTTGISIIVKGDTLCVANVGDSRAIIASEVEGILKYAPLSSDQTPYRKDERERLKLKGAKIMTLEQIEGNEPMHENWGAESGDSIDESGDPPREWDQTLEKPGCAFTRSFGDSVAEAIGVYAVPEILSWTVSPFDKLAVIASDGVFEFLTSQAVIDIISKYGDLVEGAKHVVEEAYRLWLTYDDRTDDITIIVIAFKDFKYKATSQMILSKDPSIKSISIQQAHDNKPVRRVMSKAKRKDISEMWNKQELVDFDFKKYSTQKTPDELARISSMTKSNFMFANLYPVQRDQIFQVMQLKHVKEGDNIIREGDKGDEMYIIDSGEFVVSKRDEYGVSQAVVTYTTSGISFGELSLLYGKPRAASVRAKTDGKLWSISRQAFRAVLMKRKQEGLLQTIKSLPLLHDIRLTQLQRICELAVIEEFTDKQDINKLNYSWTIGIILSGEIKLIPLDKSDSPSSFRLKRGVQTYILSYEIDRYYKKCVSDGSSSICIVPTNIFIDIISEKKLKYLYGLIDDKHDNKNIHVINSPISSKLSSSMSSNKFNELSIFSQDDKQMIRKSKNRNDYELDIPIATFGDYSYLGIFHYKGSTSLKSNSLYKPTKVSIKVIAKKKAVLNYVDSKLLQEKEFLAALINECYCIPQIISTYQDNRIVMLIYHDIFICDLGLAITSNVLEDHHRLCFITCLYSAIMSLHDNGIIHRFINPGSVFITNKGIAKLVDMRNAKKMDGSKSYTICGDPLYFAPELVSQQGYNYAVDLWAFGCVVYEIYEGLSPFGTIDTEETQLFKQILAFQPTDLKFSSKTTIEASELIYKLLVSDVDMRYGYKSCDDIKGLPYFNDVYWESVGSIDGTPLDIQASVDLSTVFNENDLEEYSSSVFDHY